jgi:hypothetical protein
LFGYMSRFGIAYKPLLANAARRGEVRRSSVAPEQVQAGWAALTIVAVGARFGYREVVRAIGPAAILVLSRSRSDLPSHLTGIHVFRR